MGATLWYLVTGTGGPITLSTRGSNFDTVLAVYNTDGSDNGPPAQGNFIACDNDGNSFGNGESELFFNSLPGLRYLVQVGGFRRPDGTVATGSLVLDAFAAPPNDDRANARDVAMGTATPADNLGATLQSGEVASCEDAPYGKTVWFRWVAPATGDVVFAANSVGVDTILAAYLGGAPTAVGCSDDAVGSGTSSRLARRVEAGETYLIQVGGFGAGQAASAGAFSFVVEFTQDLDLDDDGSSTPADCNDRNPSIRPGAIDIPENGIDENCDGRDAVNPDRDNDRFAGPQVGGPDCNDANPFINPGAPDIPGDRIDQDCKGGDATFPRILSKTILRANPARGRRGFKLTRTLQVQEVPSGARVEARCKRGRRGCGSQVVPNSKNGTVTLSKFPKGKLLRPRSVLVTIVT